MRVCVRARGCGSPERTIAAGHEPVQPTLGLTGSETLSMSPSRTCLYMGDSAEQQRGSVIADHDIVRDRATRVLPGEGVEHPDCVIQPVVRAVLGLPCLELQRALVHGEA